MFTNGIWICAMDKYLQSRWKVIHRVYDGFSEWDRLHWNSWWDFLNRVVYKIEFIQKKLSLFHLLCIFRWRHCVFNALWSPKVLPYSIYCYTSELRTCINAIQMKCNIPFYSQLTLIHLALYAVWNTSTPTRGDSVNLKQQYIRLVLGYQVDDSPLN